MVYLFSRASRLGWLVDQEAVLSASKLYRFH